RTSLEGGVIKRRLFVNLLSLSRVFLGLLFFLLLQNYKLLESLLVFLIGVFSDKLDGFLARKLRVEKGWLGRIIDPVSDRIFVAFSFLGLYLTPLKVDVSFWVVFFTLGQDMLLAPLSAYVAIRRRRAVVSLFGKLATLYQYVFVLLLLTANLTSLSLNPTPFELLLLLFNLLSAGHHLYLWLLKGRNGVF
ncbi:MAG: CDP-alcohol phosphatidyltransferase family protein, partial [Aquificaceae bacterium]|nr:CDP-alcohol phosphatidyltransferase family protein [Aquificaceae bacterium]